VAIDRSKAFEVSDDGFLICDGTHISSGVVTPTHTGLKGDRYFKTDDATQWKLLADGNDWYRVSEEVCIEHCITQDKTVLSGTTCLESNTVIKDGVEYTIEDGGHVYVVGG